MRVLVVWWDLAGTAATIEGLRRYLRDLSAPGALSRIGAAFA